ncbi:MAG: ABC transporter substrate-binding protein [Candidatus Marinimicrobia bacterium]|nr:ABC transporter substrate-binding protein [Candidatus Neomarinimicrobiota bacterium]
MTKIKVRILIFILSLSSVFALPQVGSGQTNITEINRSTSLIAQMELNRSSRQFDKGVEHYKAGRFYSALEIFRQLMKKPISENSQLTASYLMAMKCNYHLEKYEEAKRIGRNFLTDFSDSNYLDDVYHCFGDIFIRESGYRTATESYLIARSVTVEPELAKQIDKKLKKLTNGFLTRDDITDLLAFEKVQSNRTILTLMLADAIIAEGDSDGAALTLFRMDINLIPKSFRDYYDVLRKRTYKQTEGNIVIGVVLPLTGINEEEGNAFLLGLKQAIVEVQQTRALNIILEVLDNEGDNLKTIECMDKLVGNPNVMAIIGPLSAVNSTVAVSTAKHYGIPFLIPVSTQSGLSTLGESIFQMNMDLIKRGQYIAEYAIRFLGLETVAVVSPAERLGIELVDGFVERADELGAHIVDIQWYSGLPVDLKNQFKALRKVAFRLEEQYNQVEIIDLQFDTLDQTLVISEKDFFPELVEEEEISSSDSSKIVLSSIDGIFVPIHPGDINYVGSQISSYNFDTQLLGNMNWYDLDELSQEMIGPNVKGMIVFTDFIFPEDDEAMVVLSDRLQHHELRKMALHGYDITMFLASRLQKNITKHALAQNLNQAGMYRGISKLFSFTDHNPRENSSIHILRFEGDHFTKVNEIIADTLFIHSLQSP